MVHPTMEPHFFALMPLAIFREPLAQVLLPRRPCDLRPISKDRIQPQFPLQRRIINHKKKRRL